MDNSPVFYEIDKWIYEDVYFVDPLPKDISKEEEYWGNIQINVGTYGEHRLYIRGEMCLHIDPNLDFNDEQFNLYINLFSDDGSFIFDVEKLGKNGDYEKAKEILNGMWDKYESICDKYWRKYENYQYSYKSEIMENVLKYLEEKHPDQYKQLMHLKELSK